MLHRNNVYIVLPRNRSMETKESIKQMLKESKARTPKDSRSLIPLYYKKDVEYHSLNISLNRQTSSFENARQELLGYLQKQRKDQTFGWIKNDIKVYREIEYDYTKEQIKENREHYFKYGFINGIDKTKYFKFIIEHKNKSRDVFYLEVNSK